MNIATICTRRVVTIDAEGTLAAAATLMRDNHVGALVVTVGSTEGPYAAGLVTDRDLVLEVLAPDLDPAEVTIGDLASTEIASISEDDDLTDAIGAMQSAGVRRLLVTDAGRRVTGIVSFDDLVLACAGQVANLAGVISAGISREVDEAAPAATTAPPYLRVPAMAAQIPDEDA